MVSLFTAGRARADQPPPKMDVGPPRGLRVGFAGTAGVGYFHRTESSPHAETGLQAGAELRVHPFSPHGIVIGYTHASVVFGPTVDIVDAAYSLQLIGSRRLRNGTGAVYLDIGPAVGVVGHPPSPDHAVLGGRATVTGDVHFSNFLLGMTLGYRGGVPTGDVRDRWEGAFCAFIRVGSVFDFLEY